MAIGRLEAEKLFSYFCFYLVEGIGKSNESRSMNKGF